MRDRQTDMSKGKKKQIAKANKLHERTREKKRQDVPTHHIHKTKSKTAKEDEPIPSDGGIQHSRRPGMHPLSLAGPASGDSVSSSSGFCARNASLT